MREMCGLLAAVLFVAACGGGNDSDETAAADSVAVEDAAAAAALLSPVRAVSMAEVEFAQLATQRSAGAAIRQYARTVAADHRALIGTLDSVAQLRGTTLAPAADAQELENTVRMAHSGLENLAGPDFELPFVRAEVESHRLLLDRLDQQLIPSATSEDVRALLTDIRAMADAHLTRARQLLAEQLGQSTERLPPTTPARPPQPRAVRPDTPSPRPVRPDTLPPPPPPDTLSLTGAR
ncbi:MAG TPA: DUF4142 domain-containing protein [Longimicrobiales bacterium]